MARVDGIKRGLKENNIDENLIKDIIGNGDIVNIIIRMDKLLNPIIVHQILDACACCTGKSTIYYKQTKKYGKEIAGKTLKEKITDLGNYNFDFGNTILNDDNTLTTGMYLKENGKYNCVCSAAIKAVTNDSASPKKGDSNDRLMPLSYCYCCAGHFRCHLQNALDIKLKTKEIVSSPINSRGEKPCKFIFDIID